MADDHIEQLRLATNTYPIWDTELRRDLGSYKSQADIDNKINTTKTNLENRINSLENILNGKQDKNESVYVNGYQLTIIDTN